ncbi:MAG: Flp pilus assembly protein CpaB [Rhodobacteraceae bacterium]|jgi:pilus assembly protein CpaB|nr:Flp pilus assembly protein CpaB [Paracoccaceae bacterium]
MRAVFGLVLLLGVGLAGGAVYMARGYIADYQAALAAAQAAARPPVEMVDVIVTTAQVQFGESLTRDNTTIRKWPKDALPEGAFTSVETMFPQGFDVPRRALRMLEAGEVLMQVKATEPGQDAGVASRLGPGMRAFTIQVDAQSGVSGFLRAGDSVDVFWTGRPPTGDRGEFTQLIDSGLRIIAIDQDANMDREGARVARTVTVEVSPQQVANLAQAQSSGRLSLALVGAADTTVATAIQVDQRALLGIEDAVVEQREAEQVCTVRTRRGAEIIETRVECPQ